MKIRAGRIVDRIAIKSRRRQVHVSCPDHIQPVHIQIGQCPRKPAGQFPLHTQASLLHPRRFKGRRKRRDLAGCILLPRIGQRARGRAPRTVNGRIRIGRKYLLLVEICIIQGKKGISQSIVIHHRRLINLWNASIKNSKARPHHQRVVHAPLQPCRRGPL